MTSGLLLTFEGLDGSGKTTQMHALAARLREEGQAVLETVEPGGTAIGANIRQILLDPASQGLSATAELLLYFAARAQNIDECIEPALLKGTIVLSDRFTDSTIAYQGGGRELGEDVVLLLDRIACRGRKPDLTFWVDIDRTASLERARARNRKQPPGGLAQTRMDDQAAAFYERVQIAYERLRQREPERIRRIEGSGSVAEVASRVWREFSDFRARRV
jgi:dTMP kinase